MKHYELGQEGEKLAREYLQNNDYTILETNWRSKGYEVDIIARYNNLLVIVEVKSRSSTVFCKPHEAVNRNKQISIIKVAESYIYSQNIELEVRFDIIEVVFGIQRHEVKHIENAFYPLL